MEFVETPSFWYPHVDHVADTNVSTRTVELRPSKRQEILHFFLFPFLFSFPSLSTNSFFFPLRILFFLLLSFFSFLFCFSLFFSHHFSFSFLFSHFIFSFGIFSFFWIIIDRLVKGGSFLPLSSCHLCGPQFSFIFLNSFISFYCFINHVANCEPHIRVHHMDLAMCPSLRVSCDIPLTMLCVIQHPTPRKTCNSDCLGIQLNSTWY